VGHGIFSKAAVGHEVKKVENPCPKRYIIASATPIAIGEEHLLARLMLLLSRIFSINKGHML